MRAPECRRAKPMPDEQDCQEQLENVQLEAEAGTEPSQEPDAGRSFGRGVGESLFGLLDPFEDPESGMVVLGVGVIALIGWVIWAVLKGAFLGGDPPQGLGLN